MKKIVFLLIIIINTFVCLQSCSSPSEKYKRKTAEKEIKLWLQRHQMPNKTIIFIDNEAPNEANVEYYSYFIGHKKDSLILSYGYNEGYLESGYVEIVPSKNMEVLLLKQE
ncbi:hypothetical protein [Chryseobacterium sp.]|uniref:hypothetical protein n=1 Tax=Chryseobacterium sp. TaxID=1871047 RepID=UPI000EE778ED|nr:hypothetical protein [Chryseobacterium sp.]HCA08376.1 hypothetical protein [Chryseobacterium sp.]